MIEEHENQETTLQDLIDIVERDDLPTNEFTIQDKDPMVILGKLNEVVSYLKTLNESISASDTKANEALQMAMQAIADAKQALNVSNTSETKATQALANAVEAVEKANTAVSSASNAESIANSADTKANNAVETANKALNQVVQGLGSKVYDNNNNLMPDVKFSGQNGINVDIAEDDPSTLDIRLDNSIAQAIEDNSTQSQNNATNIRTINNKVTALETRTTDVEAKNAEQDAQIQAQGRNITDLSNNKANINATNNFTNDQTILNGQGLVLMLAIAGTYTGIKIYADNGNVYAEKRKPDGTADYFKII